MRTPILLSSVLLGACYTTLDGSGGELTLSYVHGGLLESVSNPIAAGLMAKVQIQDASSDQTILIASAEAGDASVLAVDTISEDRMIISGLADGQATLLVNTASGIEDRFTLQVQSIDAVQYTDLMLGVSADEYAIASGATVLLPRTVYGADGQILTGYGLSAPAFVPEGSAEFVSDGESNASTVHFPLPGEVTVSVGDGAPITYSIVDGAEVDWTIDYADEETLPVNSGLALSLTGADSTDRLVVGSLSSFDETICTVTSLLDSATLFMVATLAEGECQLALNGDFSAPVVSYSIIPE